MNETGIIENTNIASTKKDRFSGIELLRIIAMFLICLSHAVQTAMNYIAYFNSQVANVFLNLLGYAGQIGNIIHFHLKSQSNNFCQIFIQMCGLFQYIFCFI